MARKKAIKKTRKSAPKRKYKKRKKKEGDIVILNTGGELYKPAQHPTMQQMKVDDVGDTVKSIFRDFYTVDTVEVKNDTIHIETEDSITSLDTDLTEKLWSLGLMVWCMRGTNVWLKHSEKMNRRGM